MKPPSHLPITELLRAWNQGDKAALDQITTLVYQELHRLARRQLNRHRHGDSLQTSALVNEAWLRLAGIQQVEWQDRVHFFAVSANLMRNILVDFVRQQQSRKRGGGVQRVTLDDALGITREPVTDLVALDEALQTLATLDARQSRVVELRFFGGLSIDETAAVLKVSSSTIRGDWRAARAWLRQELTRL